MMVIKKWLAILVLFGCITNAWAQPVPEEYAGKVQQLHDSIYQYYYNDKTKLFTETNDPAANEKKHSYLWPLCALVQAANEMESLQPGKQYIYPVLQAIRQYYSTRPPAPGFDSYVVAEGGGDRFYDDNQWIAITCLDAYNRTHKKEYLDLSKEIYRFMMTGFSASTGGGLYWKEGDTTTKNTCSNGPGVLIALELYKITHQKKYLDTALLLYQWTNKNLLSPEGLYYDAIKIPGNQVDKRYYTYNSGTMLQSNVLLYSITSDQRYLKEAQRLAAASLNHFYKDGRYPGNHWFNAVLLRGYIALYKADGEKKYIQSIISDADAIWNKEMVEKKPTGKHATKKLLDQAGLLEIYARIAKLKKEGF
jgi:Glycosyl hydrolase family 76